VIWFVLSVGIMNLGLGYALAVALSDAPLIPQDFFARVKSGLRGDEALTAETDAFTEPPTLSDLPAGWRDQLSGASLQPETWLEGLLLKLWVEVTPHREQLLTAEVRGRLALSRLDPGAQEQLLIDAAGLQESWRGKVQLIQAMLQARLHLLGEETALAESFDELLDRQAKLHVRGSAELEGIDLEHELELGSRRLLASLTTFIRAAHELRDGLLRLWATKTRGSSAPAELGAPHYLDALTGQISRLGFESLLSTWWQDDPQRLRLASCALIKVDRLARLNDRLGHRAGDRLLTAIASLLASAIRTDRGFDRLARYAGGTFVLFFGDTGAQNAGLVIERIRQSFEALTLDYEGNELDVSISAGIVSLCREDDLDSLFARGERALASAQNHGRNRTSVDDGEGPAPLYEPNRYPVRAQRVLIEAA
jgi:diguanylate cyclase